MFCCYSNCDGWLTLLRYWISVVDIRSPSGLISTGVEKSVRQSSVFVSTSSCFLRSRYFPFLMSAEEGASLKTNTKYNKGFSLFHIFIVQFFSDNYKGFFFWLKSMLLNCFYLLRLCYRKMSWDAASFVSGARVRLRSASSNRLCWRCCCCCCGLPPPSSGSFGVRWSARAASSYPGGSETDPSCPPWTCTDLENNFFKFKIWKKVVPIKF